MLESSRKQGEKTELPFTIDWQTYDQLDPRLQTIVGSGVGSQFGQPNPDQNQNPFTNNTLGGGTQQSEVVFGVVTPDIEYVEPYYVKAEGYEYNSFIAADLPPKTDDNGNIIPDDNDEFVPGTNVKVKRRVKAGQITRNVYYRYVRSSGDFSQGSTQFRQGGDQKYYVERSHEYSSQDPGFDNEVTKVFIKEFDGTPPEPTVRTPRYKTTEATSRPVTSGTGNGQMTVTSDNYQDVAPKGSASVDGAKNRYETIVGLGTQMRRSSMQNSTCQVSVRWFHPQLRPGDPIQLGGWRFTPPSQTPFVQQGNTPLGTWRVTNISWTLEYKGIVKEQLLVTTPGTQMTLGLDRVRYMSIGSAPVPNQSGTGTGTPQVDGYAVSQAGDILPKILPDSLQNPGNY